MTIEEVTRYGRDEGVAVVTTDHPPLDALSHPVRTDLIARALRDPAVGAVVTCAGRTVLVGVARRGIDDDEVRARILADGEAARACGIDMACLAGDGWPRDRDGPMFRAGLEALPGTVETPTALAAIHGAGFTVAPLAAQDRTVEEAH